jgi:hypothetical protein
MEVDVPFFRIAIPGHVVFDVRADTASEALQTAREVQLDNDCGWDVSGVEVRRPGLIDGVVRCYIDTEAPAPTEADIQDERDEDQ